MIALTKTDLSKLFCYGAKPSDSAKEFLEYSGLKPGFIQGVSLLLDNGRAINTIILDDTTVNLNPLDFTLDYKNGTLSLTIGKRAIPVHLPPRYSVQEQKYRDRKISDLATFHNEDTLFLTPYTGCVFAYQGNICQFCTFEEVPGKGVPAEEIYRWVKDICKERSRTFSVAMGSGTPNLNDHGVRYNADIAKLIKPIVHEISVEMVPPNDLRDLLLLKKAGVHSLVMSMEIWDDDLRGIYCPGKSYVPKQHYLDAWSEWNSLSQSSRVSSVFIVGLEPIESLKEGIDNAIKCGVVPTLIPFRPYSGIKLEKVGFTNHDFYSEISDYCAKALVVANLSPKTHAGCALCGGCSLEIDIAFPT